MCHVDRVIARQAAPQLGLVTRTLHHRAELEVVSRGGIPVTTPARTLLDLAASGGAAELERAVEEARSTRLVTRRELDALIEPGRRGARRLRDLLAAEPALTRSEAEQRLLVLLRRARLPSPRTNVRVGAYEIDALWADHRLVVEVDGYRFHSGRTAFERDRRRDAERNAAGYRVLRVT